MFTCCAKLESLLRDVKKKGEEVKWMLEAEVVKLREKLENMPAALCAKKALIKDLKENIQQVKGKSASYKEGVVKVSAQSDAKFPNKVRQIC